MKDIVLIMFSWLDNPDSYRDTMTDFRNSIFKLRLTLQTLLVKNQFIYS
jgi:hypothetical protein